MKPLPAVPMSRIENAYRWATNSENEAVDVSVMCATRDVFRARLDRLYREMMNAKSSESDGALLTAAVGEIGNNCFDHNLGQWRDIPGCWFDWGYLSDYSQWWVLLADRGQGVLASLGRVDSSIQTDQAALDAAFSRILSGRHPEKRGNGLKFVKHVVNGDSRRGLLFLSGTGRMVLGNLGSAAEKMLPSSAVGKNVPGTWALLLGAQS